MKKELRNKKKAFGLLVAAFLLLAGSGTAWGQADVVNWGNGGTSGGVHIYGQSNHVVINIDGIVYIDGPIMVVDNWPYTTGGYNTPSNYTVTVQPKTPGTTCTIKRATGYTGEIFQVKWAGFSTGNLNYYAGGHLIIKDGVTFDGENVANCDPFIHVYLDQYHGNNNAYSGDCDIQGTSSYPVYFINNKNAAIINEYHLTGEYCRFEGNQRVAPYNTDAPGGAISSTGSITIDHSIFNNNSVTNGDGGAIYLDHAVGSYISTISNCDFTENSATHATEGRGGAIFFGALGGLFSNGNHFGDGNPNHGNVGRTRGGAIYSRGALVCQPDATTGRNCEFHYNKTTSMTGSDDQYLGGAALYIRGALTANNCLFSHNKSVYDGGAIYNYGDNHNGTFATVNLTNCTFEYNEGHNGGAITHSQSALMEATSCTFSYNKALNELSPTSGEIEGGNGGAIFSVSWAKCDFISCTFDHNQAMSGGAVYSQKALTLDRCEFDSNEVIPGVQSGANLHGLGGALFYGGTTADHNGTYPIHYAYIKGGSMHDNTAIQDGWGGAIFTDKTSNAQSECKLYIQSTTVGGTTYTPDIYDNHAINGAGIYAGGGAEVIMSAGQIRKNTTSNTNSNVGYGGGVNVTGGSFTLTGGSIGVSGTGNANSALYGGGVYVGNGGTFNLNGANAVVNYNTAVDGNLSSGVASTGKGAGIYSRGTTNLTLGTVQLNSVTGTAKYGAGVYVHSGTTTLQGATIQSHTNADNGAGVYVADGVFNHTSGVIRDNSATNGAGVYLDANGTFNLSGGYVGQQSHANAATNGGGVYVNGGTFNMTGGNIVYNTASQDGAGVYLAAGTFNFENQGALEHNTATHNGGGVYVDNTASFNMKNSLLQLNTANNGNGGGVYVNAGGTFNMWGTDTSHSCEVTQNKSISGTGGGVYQKGTTILRGLILITDNTQGRAVNNMYLDQTGSATNTYSHIHPDGLLCGSYIGLNNSTNSIKVVEGQGTNATYNVQYAYRNDFYHHDGNSLNVYPSTSGPFQPSSSSLYLTSASSNGQFLFALANGATAGTDYAGTYPGSITEVRTLKGLALLAKDVFNGNDYENQTVTLKANIALGASDNWEPIGYRVECDPRPFKGTFDGQFHTISGLRSDFGYLDGGLFGYTEGATIKNVLIASGTGTKASENLGALVGYLHGGTVVNCEARVASLTGETGVTANVGGLVGLVDNGGKVHSSCAMPGTLANGTNIGGLVGRVMTGSYLVNSFAHTAVTKGIIGLVDNGGVVQNCYVWGNAGNLGTGTINYCYANAGSASGSNGVFGNTSLVNGKYGYNHQDQQVSGGATAYVVNGGLSNTGELGGLLATLNKWVGTSSEYSKWTRTMASNINGDYPVLMFADAKCLGSKDGIFIDYATDLNPMITAYNNATNGGEIYLYDVPSKVTVANNANVKIFVNEHIGFLQSVSLQNVRTGITLDNSSSGFMSYDWHMFSPALTNAPMGLTYNSMVSGYHIYSNYSNYKANGIPESVYSSNAMDPPATAWNTTAGTIGYFPTNTPYGAPHSTLGCFDFYCYSEEYTHWVNFKREGKRSPEFFDHWRQNEDANGMHLNIPYENESNMVRGKGYMVAIDKTSMLMTDGSLDNNQVLVDVTNTATLSGQEAALKGVNLIGNPYQAYLDFNQIGNNLNTYFVLDADAKGYIAYVSGGSRPTESGVINCDAPQYLHPHQGFFVRVPQGTTNITLNNTMILAGGKGTSTFRSEANHYPMVNMAVEDEHGRRDYTTVELDRPDEGGGEKIRGLHAGDASLWVSYGGQDWQVAFTKPGLREVPVRFEAYKDGTYTLSWETHNGYFSYMHLIDNLTGTDIDCLQANEYRFEATTHDYTSRFRLVFEFTGVEENDEPTEGPTSFAFMMGDELVINGEGMLEMFDLNGRCLFSETLHGTQSTVSLPQTASGVYILRLTANQQTRTQKMVINK